MNAGEGAKINPFIPVEAVETALPKCSLEYKRNLRMFLGKSQYFKDSQLHLVGAL